MEPRMWHYVMNGNQEGPVAEDVLRGMLSAGTLAGSTLVWTAGYAEWVVASGVPSLAGACRPADAGMGYAQSVMEVDYAGFWKRVGAALIDGLIVIFLALPVGLVLGLAGAGEGYLGNIAGIVVGWLYFALMESSEKQATLGKQALGIQVTGLDGERITFGRATGRHFAKWLSSITLGIGYIMAAFTERKQCLHDMVANCLVVNR